MTIEYDVNFTRKTALGRAKTDAREALRKWRMGGEIDQILRSMGYTLVAWESYKFHKKVSGYHSNAYATIDIYNLIIAGRNYLVVYSGDENGRNFSEIVQIGG